MDNTIIKKFIKKRIEKYRGGLSIIVNNDFILDNFTQLEKKVPEQFIECKKKRDGPNYHLTIISSGEYDSIDINLLESKSDQIFNTEYSINVVGLGTNDSCYYLVCVSGELDNLRKDLELSSKDFHITLGFNQIDCYTISKSIDTIIIACHGIITNTIENLGLDSKKNIHMLKQLLAKYPEDFSIIKNLSNEYAKISNYSEALGYSRLLIDLFPNKITSYYILLKLFEKTDSYDIESLKNMLNNIKQVKEINPSNYQMKIVNNTIWLLNNLSIKFNFINNFDNNLSNSIVQTDKLDKNNLSQIDSDWFEIIGYDQMKNQIIPIKFIGKFNHVNLIKTVDYINLKSNQENLEHNYTNKFLETINNILIDSNTNPNKNILIYNQVDSNYVLDELPGNFSKVDSNLYGSGIVKPNHIKTLKSLKINTIINLIGEEKPNGDFEKICEKYGIKLYHFGFTDRTACEMELFLKIQEVIKTKSNVCLVHCLGGIGRTNMILSGYLIEKNLIPPSEAIGILKKSRKVIMVPEQILFLKKYYGHIINLFGLNSDIKNTQNSLVLSLPSNLPLPLPLPLILPLILPIKGLILMVGLPCSGKSTISMGLFTKFSNLTNSIIHLNQDEIGKNACEQMLSSKAKSADLIILDRCNPTSSDRIHWINMYRGLTNKKITVIFLNLGLDISLDRLTQRKNHLTLESGVIGNKIIEDMSKKLIVPIKSEGWDEMIQINNLEELDKFYRDYKLVQVTNQIPNANTDTNVNIYLNQSQNHNQNQNQNHQIINQMHLDKIIKFPRTKHIVNLGAMARDDLLMEKSDIESMLSGEVYVEEKIDGANLGFRLGPDGKIQAQNRSHYVCSSSHAQFKKLDQWIESKKFGLDKILSSGNYIIYGEWLYSKHSINYTSLPDYFIMFDLYNIDNKTFESRSFIEQIIQNTGISLVPLIYKGKASIDKLKSFVKTKSQFYDGVIEGIYVRSYESNKLKYRAKIVRADFISGDEHWTKGKQIINSIKY